jgi:menaquinone-dependent protoporphyrinogen oxidase
MYEVPVFYATTEGQTRRIADRLAAALRGRGLDSAAIDLRSDDVQVDWARVRGALVGASVHAGRHQPEAAAFIRPHAAELNALPSGFFSVSLSAGSSKPGDVETACVLARDFVTETGWTARLVRCFAGRLAYTQYGFFKRLVMRFIARRTGQPTDTSRDYEFTDWTQVIRLADEIADAVGAPPRRRRPVEKRQLAAAASSGAVQVHSHDVDLISSAAPLVRRAG